LLARTAEEVDIVQDDLFGIIAEVNILENDIALEFDIAGGVAVFAGDLPGPQAGAVFGRGDAVVRFALGVDQRDVALVHFGLLVRHGKDTLAARGRTPDGVGSNRDLVDGPA